MPLVLGPDAVPVVTEVAAARADPELAVLSAMAHVGDADAAQAARIAEAALAASVALDRGRSLLYCDAILVALSQAARKVLQSMDPGTKTCWPCVIDSPNPLL